MERAVQIYAILNFTIIGVSHIVRPRAWVDFFIILRERGEQGVFATAFLSLIFGTIVVSFHNVWSGIPIILTVIGWAQVLKAAVYFIFPAYGLAKLQIPSHERPWQFVVPGAAFVVLAGVLGYHVWILG